MIKLQVTEITSDVIKKVYGLINRHHLIALENYYKGEHVILDRYISDSSKPNNKLVHSFPAYITDVNTGYFLGAAVSYDSMNEQLMGDLQNIFDYNDEQDENVQLAKESSIKGVSYELLYLDEQSNIRFNRVAAEDMAVVYDTRITPEPLFAVRWYKIEAQNYAEVRDKQQIYYYNGGGAGYTLTGTAPHPFGDVPVVVFPNNDEWQGDFEKVLTLIDAYDLAQSDTANDFEYFTDAYLWLNNLHLDTDDVNKLKINRVLQTDGEHGKMEWIVKNIQDIASQNYKNRIQADIHRFSKTPNLTDESFSANLSGVALAYKLLGLEWNCSTKERKFKRALQRRIELICNALAVMGRAYDWREVQIKFSRNLPQNVQEMATIVSQLKGIISESTLLGLLPFVEDPSKEIEKMDAEADAMAERTSSRGVIDLDEEVDDQ